jgi:hypothetical protein
MKQVTGTVTEASDRAFVLWRDGGPTTFTEFYLAQGVKPPAAYDRVRVRSEDGLVRSVSAAPPRRPRSR